MKTPIATILGLAAVGVSAQTTSNTSTVTHASTLPSAVASAVYTTEYYDDCTHHPSSSSPTLLTVTGTTTETYCPACTETSATRAAGYTTTYATVYSVFCSTGLTGSTYTVTDSCSSTGTPYPSTYIPQGFTVTTSVCTVCPGPEPLTATLTMPTSCLDSSVTRAAGSAPAMAPSGAGAVPTPPAAPASSPAPAPESAKYMAGPTGSPAPAPDSSAPGSSAPGSSAPGSPAPGSPAPSTSPSTSPITPFEGGATSLSMGVSTVMAILGAVGVVAFAL
ncbi:hypothetical protein MMC16_005468 [Acarospora aff. strigata]|nr:hypothetical protein [Acarospora aff. strigata]